MSKKTPAPVPAGKKTDADKTPEESESGQDESGKTAAPQSPQGVKQKPKPAPHKANKHEDVRPM